MVKEGVIGSQDHWADVVFAYETQIPCKLYCVHFALLLFVFFTLGTLVVHITFSIQYPSLSFWVCGVAGWLDCCCAYSPSVCLRNTHDSHDIEWKQWVFINIISGAEYAAQIRCVVCDRTHRVLQNGFIEKSFSQSNIFFWCSKQR